MIEEVIAAAQLAIEPPPACPQSERPSVAYDVRRFVETLRFLKVTPHIAAKVRHSAVDRRTTRHAAYEVSQRKRKLVEQIFGWLKTVGLMRKTRHRGTRRVGWMFVFTLAVHNLVRLRNLQAASG